MKIRTDFITNSSSSSFVVFGVELEKIPKDLIKKYKNKTACEMFNMCTDQPWQQAFYSNDDYIDYMSIIDKNDPDYIDIKNTLEEHFEFLENFNLNDNNEN